MEFHRLIRRISEYDIGDIPQFPPPPSPKPHFLKVSPLVLFLLILIGVSALVFTCITVLRRRRSVSNRTQIRTNPETSDPVAGVAGDGDDDQREFLDENHGPVVDHPIWYIRTVGLPQSVIDSIAIFKYKKDDGLTEETDCTICLSKFLEEETLRLLPKCSHAFHIPCIDTWLRSHQNCPLCRAPVVCNTTTDSAQTSVPEANSDQLEDTQVENSEDSDDDQVAGTENFGELTRGVTDESSTKNPLRIRVLSDIGDHRINVEEESQPAVRRSVSLDASSASVIYLAVSSISHDNECEGSSSGVQLAQVKKSVLDGVSISRLMKSASFGYSLQRAPASMKRSFSSFRRMSSRRHCKSQDSILPL